MNETNLRSHNWFGRKGKDGFIYRAWMKKQGIPVLSLKANLLLIFVIRGQN